MAEEAQDVKPKLNIHVEFEGQTCTMKIKANTPFKKVFEAAEQRFGKGSGTIRFVYNGDRVQPHETPADLEMEDDEVIQGFLQQLGGSRRDH